MSESRNSPETEYLKTPAAATFVGLGTRTLEAMRDRNEGPPVIKLGRRLFLYEKRALRIWLERHKQTPEAA